MVHYTRFPHHPSNAQFLLSLHMYSSHPNLILLFQLLPPVHLYIILCSPPSNREIYVPTAVLYFICKHFESTYHSMLIIYLMAISAYKRMHTIFVFQGQSYFAQDKIFKWHLFICKLYTVILKTSEFKTFCKCVNF